MKLSWNDTMNRRYFHKLESIDNLKSLKQHYRAFARDEDLHGMLWVVASLCASQLPGCLFQAAKILKEVYFRPKTNESKKMNILVEQAGPIAKNQLYSWALRDVDPFAEAALWLSIMALPSQPECAGARLASEALLVASGAYDERLSQQMAAYNQLFENINQGWDKPLEKLLVERRADVGWCLGYRDTTWGRTGLHWACMGVTFGTQPVHLPTVDQLLKQGADPNATDIDGATPLHIAAAAANPQVCALLLSFGASVDCVDKRGRTPLQVCLYAVGYGRLQSGANTEVTVDLLISRGAKVTIQDKWGLHPMSLAAWSGHLEVAQMCLKAWTTAVCTNASVGTETQKSHQKVLEDASKMAVRYGVSRILELFLYGKQRKQGLLIKSEKKDPVPLSMEALNLSSLLMLACETHQLKVAQTLLTAGASADFAIQAKEQESADQLEQDDNSKNLDGQDEACSWTEKPLGWSCLHQAVQADDLCLVQLLCSWGAPIHKPVCRSFRLPGKEKLEMYEKSAYGKFPLAMSPLALACWLGRADMVEVMVVSFVDSFEFKSGALGAGELFAEGSGVSCTVAAVLGDSTGVLDVLIGTFGSEILSRADGDGRIPLMEAALCASPHFTELLLQQGADPHCSYECQSKELMGWHKELQSLEVKQEDLAEAVHKCWRTVLTERGLTEGECSPQKKEEMVKDMRKMIADQGEIWEHLERTLPTSDFNVKELAGRSAEVEPVVAICYALCLLLGNEKVVEGIEGVHKQLQDQKKAWASCKKALRGLRVHSKMLNLRGSPPDELLVEAVKSIMQMESVKDFLEDCEQTISLMAEWIGLVLEEAALTMSNASVVAYLALESKYDEVVSQALVLEKKVNEASITLTPLMACLGQQQIPRGDRWGHKLPLAARFADTARMLIEAGADINTPSPEGDTPLYSAAGKGYWETVTLLAHHGANLEIYTKCEEGPIDVAVKANAVEATKSLLEAGASPNGVKDTLSSALHSGHLEMALLLLKHGAWIQHPLPVLGNASMCDDRGKVEDGGYGVLPLHACSLPAHSSTVMSDFEECLNGVYNRCDAAVLALWQLRHCLQRMEETLESEFENCDKENVKINYVASDKEYQISPLDAGEEVLYSMPAGGNGMHGLLVRSDTGKVELCDGSSLAVQDYFGDIQNYFLRKNPPTLPQRWLSTGYTPVHQAAKDGSTHLLKLLLAQGLGHLADSKDVLGRSPLFLALENKHEACSKVLLETLTHGANESPVEGPHVTLLSKFLAHAELKEQEVKQALEDVPSLGWKSGGRMIVYYRCLNVCSSQWNSICDLFDVCLLFKLTVELGEFIPETMRTAISLLEEIDMVPEFLQSNCLNQWLKEHGRFTVWKLVTLQKVKKLKRIIRTHLLSNPTTPFSVNATNKHTIRVETGLVMFHTFDESEDFRSIFEDLPSEEKSEGTTKKDSDAPAVPEWVMQEVKHAWRGQKDTEKTTEIFMKFLSTWRRLGGKILICMRTARAVIRWVQSLIRARSMVFLTSEIDPREEMAKLIGPGNVSVEGKLVQSQSESQEDTLETSTPLAIFCHPPTTASLEQLAQPSHFLNNLQESYTEAAAYLHQVKGVVEEVTNCQHSVGLSAPSSILCMWNVSQNEWLSFVEKVEKAQEDKALANSIELLQMKALKLLMYGELDQPLACMYSYNTIHELKSYNLEERIQKQNNTVSIAESVLADIQEAEEPSEPQCNVCKMLTFLFRSVIAYTKHPLLEMYRASQCPWWSPAVPAMSMPSSLSLLVLKTLHEHGQLRESQPNADGWTIAYAAAKEINIDAIVWLAKEHILCTSRDRDPSGMPLLWSILNEYTPFLTRPRKYSQYQLQQNQEEVMDMLWEHKAGYKVSDPLPSATLIACQKGYFQLAKRFLQEGDSLCLSAGGVTAIHLAANAGASEFIETMIEMSKSTGVPNLKLLSQALVHPSHGETLKDVLPTEGHEKGGDASNQVDGVGGADTQKGIVQSQQEERKEDKKTDDSTTGQKNTLMAKLLASRNKTDKLKSRAGGGSPQTPPIDGRVDLSPTQTVFGPTPLHAAVASGSLRCIRIILSFLSGVYPNLDIELQHSEREVVDFGRCGQSLLHVACYFNQTEAARLLVQSGSAVMGKIWVENFQSWMTPLELAVEKGSRGCVQVLIQAKTVQLGWKLVESAVWKGFGDIAIDLIEGLRAEGYSNSTGDFSSGSILPVYQEIRQIVQRGSGQETLLHHACRRGHLRLAQYLIASGVEVSQKDAFGWTCLEYSVASGHGKVSKVVAQLSQKHLDAANTIVLYTQKYMAICRQRVPKRLTQSNYEESNSELNTKDSIFEEND